jgi:hypothetical protein
MRGWDKRKNHDKGEEIIIKKLANQREVGHRERLVRINKRMESIFLNEVKKTMRLGADF